MSYFNHLKAALNHFRNEPNISHLTMEEKFNASNVPKQNLLRQIRQLEMFVRIKLNSYRFHFPRTGSTSAGNPELTSLLNMLKNLTIFRTGLDLFKCSHVTQNFAKFTTESYFCTTKLFFPWYSVDQLAARKVTSVDQLIKKNPI